jgi:hypothetical protein
MHHSCPHRSVQYYVRDWGHLRSMWFVNISNTILWFTYTKALFNTGIAKIGNKALTFKASFDRVV